jgi:predicted nucleic acid-binding protein
LIVVDASAAFALLVGYEPGASTIRAVVAEPPGACCAPELLDLEVANALRKGVLRQEIGVERAHQAMRDLRDLPLERWPHRPLMARIWGLRDALTAYDAAYVALAEALEATLLTLDRGLAQAAARTVDVARLT